MWRLLALTLAIAPTAQAETYKWVDERGVVNYSNTPPPGAAKASQKIAERVSTYEPEPQRVAYLTPSPYEAMLQQEWLQRQRLMAERQNVQTIYDGAPVDPYAPYYHYRTAYPAYYPATNLRQRQVRRVMHHTR
jgi:hypothetical protein